MNSLGVPVGERNEILKEYLGLLQMEADPKLHAVRDGMVRTGREPAHRARSGRKGCSATWRGYPSNPPRT